MSTSYIIAIVLMVFIIGVWCVVAVPFKKKFSAYDMSAHEHKKLKDRSFFDGDGLLHKYSEFESFILDRDIHGFGERGDILLCKYEKPGDDTWYILWDIVYGPSVKHTGTDPVDYKVLVVKFIIRKDYVYQTVC